MTPVWWNEVNDYITKGLVHSIHTSERLSHRGCRRRHDWVFNQGYYPLTTPKPLEFGVAFHLAMQKLYDPITWHDKELALGLALKSFKDKTHEQLDEYVRLNLGSHQLIEPEVKADYDERVELGLGMLKSYARDVVPKYDREFTPIAVEIEFEVPILDEYNNPVWCECDVCWRRQVRYWQALDETTHNVDIQGLTGKEGKDDQFRDAWLGLVVTYGGRIDMMSIDQYGGYWIFDWKTAARLHTGEDYQTDDGFLLLDDQITSYCWAMWLLGKLNDGQVPIEGFVYAEIKKAVPVEPEPNRSRRLGRLYSINKQQETTWELYEKTVSENDTEAYEGGLYDDFIAYLREFGGQYSKRHQIHRTVQELKSAGYNIYLEALDIIDPHSRVYPSPGRFSCGNCAFKEPCLGMNRGEDYIYMLDSFFDKRPLKYWEKQPSSTDKKSRG